MITPLERITDNIYRYSIDDNVNIIVEKREGQYDIYLHRGGKEIFLKRIDNLSDIYNLLIFFGYKKKRTYYLFQILTVILLSIILLWLLIK
jgi:hypothetical protein